MGAGGAVRNKRYSIHGVYICVCVCVHKQNAYMCMEVGLTTCRLLCSSFLAMTCVLARDYNILPQNCKLVPYGYIKNRQEFLRR